MPRRPRFQLAGLPRDVVERGNSREACFCAAADCRYYLDAWCAATDKFGGRVHADVLIANHVHLPVTPDRPMTRVLPMRSSRRMISTIDRFRQRQKGRLLVGSYSDTGSILA